MVARWCVGDRSRNPTWFSGSLHAHGAASGEVEGLGGGSAWEAGAKNEG